MPKCRFTAKYYDHETRNLVDFNCDDEEPLPSGFCIFHYKDYLQDKTNYEKRKRKVLNRLKNQVNHAISNNEPLLCIGFHLPEFSLSDLSINKKFTKPVFFNGSQFFGKADFDGANFQGNASFSRVNFQGEAVFVANFQTAFFDGANFHRLAFFSRVNFHGETGFNEAKFEGKAEFSSVNFQGEASFRATKFQVEADLNNSEFNGKTEFNRVLFEGKEKVTFDIENLSNVSFMNTDLTGIRFSDKARWGGKKVEYSKFWRRKKVKEDKFKIVDERLLEEKIKEKDGDTKDFNLGSIKAVYRSLRENYEYRMRFDEAGQFFIREMELKRNYREVQSEEEKEEEGSLEIKQNNWFRRNLFSLTGWYYHLSRYGESLWRPTLAGIVIVFLSTLFWLMQSDPTLEPSLPIFQFKDATNNVT